MTTIDDHDVADDDDVAIVLDAIVLDCDGCNNGEKENHNVQLFLLR